MPRTRTKSWVWVPACCALVLMLLACGGSVLLARNGRLPAFEADIQVWPGTTLSIHSTGSRACAMAARCPHQINIQSALSVWLIYPARQRGYLDTFGKRLVYIPIAEPVMR
jgi:hypothetical protein